MVTPDEFELERSKTAAGGALLESGAGRKRKDALPGALIPFQSDDDRMVQAKRLRDLYDASTRYWADDHVKMETDRARVRCNTPVEYDASLLVDDRGNGQTPVLQLPIERAVITAQTAQCKESLLGDSPNVFVTAGLEDDDQQSERVQSWLSDWCRQRSRWEGMVSEVLFTAWRDGWCYVHVPWRERVEWTYWWAQPETPAQYALALMRGLFGYRPPRTLKAGWKTIESAPQLEVVERDNVLCYPPTERDPQAAAVLFYRARVTRGELARGRSAWKDADGLEHPKRWDIPDDEWDRIFPPAAAPGAGTTSDNETALDLEALFADTELEAVYCYADWDWTGDGEALPCTFVLLPATGSLIAAYLSPTGSERPFALVHTESEADGPRFVSTPDKIRHLAWEINRYETQSVAHADLAYLLTMTAFGPLGCGLADRAWVGRFNELDADPNSIKFANPPAEPANLPKVLHLWDQIRQLTGISELQMGQPLPTQQTATAVQAVSGNANTLLANAVKTVGTCLERVVRLVCLQMRLNAEDALEYPAQVPDPMTGRMMTARKQVARDDFSDTLLFDVAGTSAGANVNARAQAALAFNNLVAADPMYRQFVEPYPDRARALLGYIAKALAVQNVEQYVGPELDAQVGMMGLAPPMLPGVMGAPGAGAAAGGPSMPGPQTPMGSPDQPTMPMQPMPMPEGMA